MKSAARYKRATFLCGREVAIEHVVAHFYIGPILGKVLFQFEMIYQT